MTITFTLFFFLSGVVVVVCLETIANDESHLINNLFSVFELDLSMKSIRFWI